MIQDKSLLLTTEQIDLKLERIAIQIMESNVGEDLLLAGINVRGKLIADQLSVLLKSFFDISVPVISIKLNPAKPADSPVTIDADEPIGDRVVIIVDDVANTGRTLFFAAKPFLEHLPRKVQVAVLVDRRHKLFPVCADYVGLTLSTTLQEHVQVEMKKNQVSSVFLK